MFSTEVVFAMSHPEVDLKRVMRALDEEDMALFGGGLTTDHDEKGRCCYYFYRDGQKIFLGHPPDEAIGKYLAEYSRAPKPRRRV